MGLNKQQFRFTFMVKELLDFYYKNGYNVAMGDVWSKPEYGAHSKNSKHYDKLAIDLNLFNNRGVFLTRTKDHEPGGLFWESMGGTWGGRFEKKDGNHYSLGE